MSVKQQAKEIVEQLEENASWSDLLGELYKQRKITIGLSKDELNQAELTDSDVSAILARLESASDIPTDMRNTKDYNPGNAVTMGMIAGVIALVFAFILPPITWFAAFVALVTGVIGVKRKEENAWVPIFMAVVAVLPILIVLE